MKAFKAFIKPFEAPQRSAKIKIYVNFFFLSGTRMLRDKEFFVNTQSVNKVRLSIIHLFFVHVQQKYLGPLFFLVPLSDASKDSIKPLLKAL